MVEPLGRRVPPLVRAERARDHGEDRRPHSARRSASACASPSTCAMPTSSTARRGNRCDVDAGERM
jgi:hypothetical protein